MAVPSIDQMTMSGQFTAAQLQAASLPNVMSLFDAPPEYRQEMAHFMQRFILDGYMRGVDVVSILRNKPQKFWVAVQDIQSTAGRPSGAVATATSKRALFDTSYWTPNKSYEAKLQTFYHEMGHALLNQRHNEADGGSRIMSHNGGSLANYQKAVDVLFRGTNVAPGGARGIISGGGWQQPTMMQMIQPTITVNSGFSGGFQGPTLRMNTSPIMPNVGPKVASIDMISPDIRTFNPVQALIRKDNKQIDLGQDMSMGTANNVFAAALKKMGASPLAG